jgi:hypothetical protein
MNRIDTTLSALLAVALCVSAQLPASAQNQATVSASRAASTQETPPKPEAIAGKYYSKAECVRIARWVIGDDKRLKTLTGIEVGNFWDTLDNCGFMHFSDPNTLYGRPSQEQIDVEIAIDWATHEYIGRLDFAIQSLSAAERDKVLSDLENAARPTKERFPLFTLHPPVGINPPLPTAVYVRVVRSALPHDLKPGDSVACIGAHNDKGELYDLGCNMGLEHDPIVGMYRAVFSENPDKDPHKLGISDNAAGSAWRCHFADQDVELICQRSNVK